MIRGTIFAIKRYALHDGPNIRTTVFLKGCPLACSWCHNPEGLAPQPHPLWSGDRCLGCHSCIRACPRQALQFQAGSIRRDPDQCDGCGECARICPARAHEMAGWQSTVEEVMAEVEKDRPFFDQSGGGVTFSGGEPLLQPRFLLALLEAAGEEEIHRVVDTSGYAPREVLARIAPHTDLFLFDLKHLDPAAHRRHTGVDNGGILENLHFLASHRYPLRIRVPLIPGINDDPDHIRRLGELVAALPGVDAIDLLPYHHSATAKYRKLNIPYPQEQLRPDDTRIDALVERLRQFDLSVRIGG
ncbi:glycyl-radical enzyme activating protein [Desulfogranum mediterraneum]|uniref:glycyl-radical enzyme activating protein n=1 Tax=Desulfogranum mediterraneum TaxID=160661 RepID=UPI00041745AE|nr:glycyl-radical enzyme activating protein [Desulfogranum mediterraneum]